MDGQDEGGLSSIDIGDVKNQFLIYAYQSLKRANENNEPIDNKQFEVIGKILSATDMTSDKLPSIDPDFLDAKKRAEKLKKAREKAAD